MSRFTTVRVFAFGAFMFLLTAHPMNAQKEAEGYWKDRQGKNRTRAELLRILKEHRVWVDSNHESGTRANLIGAGLSGADLSYADLEHVDLRDAHLNDANLSGADLSGADLSYADLEHVDLRDAHLNDANLSYADLSHADLKAAHLNDGHLNDANLSYADLSHADLSHADLRGAHLNGLLNDADLSHADLTHADLSGADLIDGHLNDADLSHADMSGARLSGADLKNAVLYDANLKRVIFEPTSLPNLWAVALAENMELLTYEDNPGALVQLRKQFEDSGFRLQERKITYALKRKETEQSWQGCKSRKTGDKTRAILWSSDSNLANCGSFILNWVFFDWTCQYGMSPGRPLSLGVLLWLLCSLLYFVCIHAPGKTGLYRIYKPILQKDSSVSPRVEEILPAEMKAHGVRRFREFIRREWLVLRASMFFSLMSAFNIGFRDINFGRWLRLLTRQEFDIKAVGWARVVAGWQSLISVYFIALWVLTYFGRPFG